MIQFGENWLTDTYLTMFWAGDKIKLTGNFAQGKTHKPMCQLAWGCPECDGNICVQSYT